VDTGLFLEEEDVIKTGLDGYLEISLTYPSEGSHLKVQPDTIFFFESKEDTGGRSARVNLLGGTLALKVNRLADNESMNVETQSAVMGIRGTEFQVSKAPTGEILVSCEEGKVSCATETGETYSLPGTVCLQNDGRNFTDEAVAPEDLESYRAEWWNRRMEALTKLGPLAMEYYLGRYENQESRFDNAWKELLRHEDIFKEYESIIESGRTPSTVKATRDKMALTSAVIRMRSALPLMEETFYTLSLLEEYRSRGNFTSGASLRNFNRDRNSREKELLKARYYLAMYAKISRYAGGGSGSALDSMLSDTSF
ncbi:MAG: FecR family protein, partial [Spirochaetales bacterium]|nr:FecR family protein [Spirochaetales bacterium]